MPDLKTEWSNIKAKIKEDFDLSIVAYNNFIKPLDIKRVSDENVFIVIPFNKDDSIDIDYYNKRFLNMIQIAIAENTGHEYEVIFINNNNESSSPELNLNNNKEDFPVQNTGENLSKGLSYANLKEDYTFDDFVVGKNNDFAYSAAVAVAENPGFLYNPLFLYGGPGVGKTHLMQAIGHYILMKNPSMRVLYVTSEQFTNELIKAIGRGTQDTDNFKKKYRNLDVLLIDDIQFIQGKESTQEEIFHTLNELHASNRAIVITSDKPPKDLKTLEERLRSRFEMGLMADIGFPNYETRAAILTQNFKKNGMPVKDDIIDYIASNITSNIRELTGATNKLNLISKNRELTLEIVKENIKEYINENNSRKITMDDIINEVCDYYSVTRDDINSSKRSQDITHPRQVATYLCRILTDNSQELIGQDVGKRYHSTVINSFNKISKEITNNPRTAAEIEEIKSRLSSK